MSAAPCQVSRLTLLRWAQGEAPPDVEDLEAHLATCGRCQAELRRFQLTGEALARAELPPQDAVLRRRHILAALQQGGERPPERAGWWRPALAVAAAALLVEVGVALLRGPAAPERALEVVSGELTSGGTAQMAGQRLADGVELVVSGPAEAELQLADGSHLWAAPGSRFVVRTRERVRVTLELGSVTVLASKRPAARALEVATDEATVRVVGTRFTVTRQLVERTRGSTEVRVEEGVVEVTPASAGAGALPQSLRAGGSARFGAPSSAGGEGEVGEATPPGETATAEAEAPEAVAEAPAAKPPRPGKAHAERPSAERLTAQRIGVIRSQIRAGRIREAQAAIESARRSGGSRADLAELALVEAEALLAEGKPRLAMSAYLTVFKGFPGTPQAEQALFAAGLTSDRLGDRAKTIELLEQYLRTYPRGELRADAERLLQALKGN